MKTNGTEFKRMVVGLPHSARDYATVGISAKLAELLRLDLVAAFLEDAGLMNMAGLPGARELRVLDGGWHQVECSRLANELDHAARNAQRLFGQAVHGCRVATSFRHERGSTADVVASLITVDDIFVVIEPKNSAERMTNQFIQLVDAAFNAASAVMIVPSRMTRSAGPVVAISAGPDDVSVATASTIADAAGEKLIALDLSDETVSGPQGESPEPASRPRGRSTSDALAARLASLKERLLVLPRGVLADSEVMTLASLRAVPVIIVEAGRTGR